MQTTDLAAVELRRLFVDVDSLLARAAAAGMTTQALAPTFGDTLMAWLRARALGFAQQQRTGVAIRRDLLRRGVERAWTSVDDGLCTESQGDVEAAVDLLASGELDRFYRAGYERLVLDLIDLRQQAESWIIESTALALLPQWRVPLHEWSRIVAETWISTTADGTSKDIDPRVERRRFEQARPWLEFAAHLPGAAARDLLEREPSFAGGAPLLLRRVWCALILQRETLPVDEGDLAQLLTILQDVERSHNARESASRSLAAYLLRILAQAHDRRTIQLEADRQWEALISASSIEQLTMAVRQELIDDDAQAARRDAEKQIE